MVGSRPTIRLWPGIRLMHGRVQRVLVTRVRAIIGFLAAALVLLSALLGIFVWTAIQGIRNPAEDQLPADADAVMVFAGEDVRFTLARELVEAGVASVLVLNADALPELAAGWCEEDIRGVRVVCLSPPSQSTRGEAQVFGQLATEEGWSSIVGVTGDYHVQRAGALLRRCFDGEVAMAPVDWGEPVRSLTIDELVAYTYITAVERSC